MLLNSQKIERPGKVSFYLRAKLNELFMKLKKLTYLLVFVAGISFSGFCTAISERNWFTCFSSNSYYDFVSGVL